MVWDCIDTHCSQMKVSMSDSLLLVYKCRFEVVSVRGLVIEVGNSRLHLVCEHWQLYK